MLIHFLIEDVSGEKLIDSVMKKYKEEHPDDDIEYRMLSYKGIGGFRKDKDANNAKSLQLLTDLSKRIRALDVALRYTKNAAVFVVVDNDDRDTGAFRKQLHAAISELNVSVDHVFCIAVEEMEAWLLGDIDAIRAGYPDIADRIATKHANYKQDSICGTWEFLAEMLTKEGFGEFTKQNPTAYDRGRRKSEWAETIGRHLNIRKNASPSFQTMLAELDARLSLASGI